MFRKCTALGAAATLAAGALIGVSAPAQAATKTIYTQCTVGYTSTKLTKKNLGTATEIVCTDLADLGPLKDVKKLESVSLDTGKKLKIKGTDKLSQLGITGLFIDAPVTDASFKFLKDFPKLTELRTGPTPVSTFTNISKVKDLIWVDVSTSKAMSYSALARMPKLQAVSTNVLSGKANLASLAKLPKLGTAGFSGHFNQSLKPLLKSKHIDSVNIERPAKSKKLSKGQKYTIPRDSGDAFIDIAIGWPGTRTEIKSVTSPGTGLADVTMMKIYELGKITVRDSKHLLLYTPGKVRFDTPRVAQKTVRAGETIRAKRPDTFSVTNWVDGESKCSFQWQRGKKDIKGATKLTYKATTADAGKTLRLETSCRPSAWSKKSAGFKANTKYSGAVKVS